MGRKEAVEIQDNDCRRYVRQVFGFIGIVITSISLLLYLVDPIGIWGTPVLNGLTHYKIGKGDYAEIGKIYEVTRLRPEVIYIGNSRVYNGFPMDASRREYNLAFNGTSLVEVRQCLRFIYSVYRPKRVCVGVEAMQLIGKPSAVRDTLSEDRLKKIAAGPPIRAAMAIWEGLSVTKKLPETIIESIRHSKEPSPYELGWNGEHGGVRQVNREEYYHTITGFRHVYDNCNTSTSDNMDTLYGILDDAKENNVEVVLFCSPISIDLQALQDVTGAYEKIRNLKCEIARVHPIYDFSWASKLTQNREEFYTDASHYNSKAGEMVKKALDGESSDLVQVLTAENVEGKLDEEYRHYLDWREKNQAYIVRLKSVSDDYIKPGSFVEYIGF